MNCEKTLNFLQGKNLACAKMAPRKEGCVRSGHVTGQRSLRGRGSRKGLQRAPTNTMLFSDYHLAKLNPKCHMNYSIIFTEISFSPETSISADKVLTLYSLFVYLYTKLYPK